MNSKESFQLMSELKLLRDHLGIGILVIDHDMEMMMELCNRMIVLNEGRLLAQGSPETIKNHPRVIEAYMGRRHVKTE